LLSIRIKFKYFIAWLFPTVIVEVCDNVCGIVDEIENQVIPTIGLD
jgi:hypothetical protein